MAFTPPYPSQPSSGNADQQALAWRQYHDAVWAENAQTDQMVQAIKGQQTSFHRKPAWSYPPSVQMQQALTNPNLKRPSIDHRAKSTDDMLWHKVFHPPQPAITWTPMPPEAPPPPDPLKGIDVAAFIIGYAFQDQSLMLASGAIKPGHTSITFGGQVPDRLKPLHHRKNFSVGLASGFILIAWEASRCIGAMLGHP